MKNNRFQTQRSDIAMPLLMNFTKSTPVTNANSEQDIIYDPVSQTVVYNMGEPRNTRSVRLIPGSKKGRYANTNDNKVVNDDIKYS